MRCALVLLLAACGVAVAQESEPDSRGRVVALIEALRSDDAGARDEASRGLIQVGAPAIPLLSQSAHDADPEVRARCEAILEEIEKSGTDALRREALRKRLEQTKICLHCHNEPLTTMVVYMREYLRASFVVDPVALEPKDPVVDWCAMDVPAWTWIEWYSERISLEPVIARGAVVFTTAARRRVYERFSPTRLEESGPAWKGPLQDSLRETLVSADLTNVGASDVCAWARKETGVAIVHCAEGVGADAPKAMSICVDDISLDDFLCLALLPLGYDFCLTPDGVFVASPDEVAKRRNGEAK